MRRLAVLTVALLSIAAGCAQADIGQPPYRLDATSSFDPYGNETAWLQDHVALIHGYGSFALEHYVRRGLPTIDYHDPSTEGYAPLTPESRQRYMQKVEADRAQGFLGVANDDVNFGLSYRDGHQNKSSYEPEAKELGALIAQERAYWPEAIIETNTQWHDLSSRLSDPNVERMIANSSLLYKEFGVGPTAGITTRSDYEALAAFDESLHPKGKGMVFGGDYGSGGETGLVMEYTLATELLLSDGHDFYSTAGKYELPPTWWPGSDVNLGEPLEGLSGTAHCWSDGLCARFFQRGAVYVLMPQSKEVVWSNPFCLCSTVYGCPMQWRLAERQGIVAYN